MKYTKEQQRVIDERDKNILVSAAAGSGKTAVLKERILSLVTEENRNVDVDHILVLTYTNAAAAEMRERIEKAITEALNENPKDENLQRQKLLIQNAQISTIHSFCLFVLKNNFGDIGLDPGFRNMDDGERKLMLRETLENILERYYEEADSEFINLVECYASGIGEGSLEDTILELHNFLLSLPFPLKWIEKARADFKLGSIEEFENKSWWKDGMLPIAEALIEEALMLAKEGLKISQMAEGPNKSIDGFKDYISIFQQLSSEKDYESRYKILNTATVSKFNDTRKADPELKAKAKTRKEHIKKCFDELIKKIYLADANTFVSDSAVMESAADKLLEITETLYKEFDEVKREKNLIDFSDMEHLVLKIFVDQNGNPTETAKEYQQYFDAVMVDEYQDINEVQESILKSITRPDNYFMVGDVKQSIYRFREAKPEIFIGKYDSFSEDGINTKIELNNNFRSRKEVLEFVNEIFSVAMKKRLSKVEYDERASLKAGAFCYTKNADISYLPEILLAEAADNDDMLNLGIGNDSRATEAMLVANKIEEIISGKTIIYDKDKDEFRQATYKDVVILVFSVNKHGGIFKAALDSKNIPYISENKTGYFKSSEVKTVLNMLEVINNPCSDIELYGCLQDFYGGFSVEEIGLVKARYKELSLYEALYAYIKDAGIVDEINIDGDGSNEASSLAKRLKLFLEFIDKFRFFTTYMGVREIIDRLVISTGYIDYVQAKKGGIQKRANVLLLLEKASDYEKTSYHGLFRFVRYIKGLKEKDTDFGEAVTLDDSEDAVRIMTIHKSKGLEYPVCFLCGTDIDYLEMDSKKSAVASAEYGLALDVVDPVKRYKRKSFKKIIFTKQLVLDNYAEQLRVLYVALTRAREKLYITATVSKKADDIKKEKSIKEAVLDRLVPEGCFFDMSMLFYRNYFSIIVNAISSLGLCESYMRFYSADDINCDNKKAEIITGLTREMLADPENQPDQSYVNEIAGRLDYDYKYKYLSGLKNKVSVSDIKKQAIHNMNESEEEDTALILENEEAIVGAEPEKFLNDNLLINNSSVNSKNLDSSEAKVEKSLIGTVCHRLMELIDYKSINVNADGSISKETIDSVIDDTIKINLENGRLSDEYARLVKTGGGTGFITYEKAKLFFDSKLAKEMIFADIRGKLCREKSFFMGIPFKEACPDYPEDEDVLVQGIIDVYYEDEDGNIVLADYKTDSLKNIALNGGYGDKKAVKARTEEEKLNALVLRYKVQLDLYARAIERITGKKVIRKVIYAFDLNREIEFE